MKKFLISLAALASSAAFSFPTIAPNAMVGCKNPAYLFGYSVPANSKAIDQAIHAAGLAKAGFCGVVDQ